MKLTLFLSMMTFFQLFATETYSQLTKLTLKLEDVKISDALKEIENQSEFFFLYSPKLIDVERKVNIDAEKESIKDILSNIFDEKVKFAVYDRQVILTPNEQSEILSAIQQKQLTGIVTLKDGTPLTGANVVVTGTTLGTMTDIAGKYSIEVPPGSKSLTFSFIGMEPQEISIGTLTQIDVTLAESAVGLEEVVVIGYGTQKKVSLTGSVVSTKGDVIVKSQAPNVVNSLAGNLPGVVINNRSGEPGRDDPTIYIRGRSTTGNADPLIIIDGVERGNLGLINPNDIESISVLKDASAAIYGARAANGVVLVTTKRGIGGLDGKANFNFSYNQGFSQPAREISMADSYLFAKVYNEVEVGAGRSPKYTEEELQKFKDGSDPNYPNTNWHDYMTKPLTLQHRTDLSVTGSTDKVKYYLSFGELSQDGQFTEGCTKIKRYNVRSNLDVKITDYFKFGLDLAGRYGTSRYPMEDITNIFTAIYAYQPNWTVYWPGTNYLKPNRDTESIINWVSDKSGTKDIDSKGLETTLFYRLDIPWVKGLSIDGTANYDIGVDLTKAFRIPAYLYYYNSTTNTYTYGRSGWGPNLANLQETYVQNSVLTLNSKINYGRGFGNHNIAVMIGYEQRQENYSTFGAYRSDYISTALPELDFGSSNKNNQANNGSASKAARMNYFGRATYDYAGKYLAQFIFRYDGSQNFPKGKRFGFFPGVSVGWRISEEPFMSKLEFIENLKIRASYGEMGNDRVSAFQYLTSYGFGNNYVIGNNDVTGIVQSGVPNPNITWEIAKTSNLGIDATLWKGLLGVEFEVFKTRRTNILTKRTAVVPDYTGLLLPDENVGIVENKGFELQLSHNNNINELKFSLNGNISFARNKVIFADEAPAAEEYQKATGRPMGSYLTYKAIGIFSTQAEIDAYPHFVNAQPGDIKYEDVNGDLQINSLDRIRINQTAVPEIIYGFNASLEYKGFDLSALLQGQGNAKVNFGVGYFPIMSYTLGNFCNWRAENHWSPDNINATMPRASLEQNNNNTISSTQWILNAGFLRLKNLELGYNVPSSACEKIKIQKLRVYISGYNLALLYDHMKKVGFDPEAVAYQYYPQQRIYNVGLNLTF